MRYKKQDRSNEHNSERIQSMLCEDTLGVKRTIIITASYCCLCQIVKGGTRNCVNNIKYYLKLNTNLLLFIFFCDQQTRISEVFKRVKT